MRVLFSDSLLGLSPNAGLGVLAISDGLDTEQWADYEFGNAPLGDKRLSKRLVNVADAKAQNPGSAFSGGVYPGDIDYVRQYIPENEIVFECHAETPYKTLELFDDE